MEETKKSSKGLIVLVIILFICVIGLGGYIVYDKLLNKPSHPIDNSNSSTTKKTVETSKDNLKKNYEIIKTDIFATVVAEGGNNYEYPLGKNNSDEKGNIWLTYPQINYHTKSIETLNRTIKNEIEENIKKIEAGENSFDTDDLQCYNINLKKDNTNHKYERLNYSGYVTIENKKHISIVKYDISSTNCASGSVTESGSYIIDKETEEYLTLENFIASQKNYNEIISSLKEYINNNYDKLFGNIYDDKTEILSNISNLLDNKEYIIYYNENDNLVIILPLLIREDSDYKFEFTDNKWNKYNDTIAGTLW